MTKAHTPGTAVTVATDLGPEQGTVEGHTNPTMGHLRYTVRFADGTLSSWNEQEVTAVTVVCWTCGGTPNPSNFGGLCDHCDDFRRQRLARSASFLRDNGMENTQECRALTALGY